MGLVAIIHTKYKNIYKSQQKFYFENHIEKKLRFLAGVGKAVINV